MSRPNVSSARLRLDVHALLAQIVTCALGHDYRDDQAALLAGPVQRPPFRPPIRAQNQSRRLFASVMTYVIMFARPETFVRGDECMS